MTNYITLFAPPCSQAKQVQRDQLALERESIQYRSLPTSTTNVITEKRRKLLQKIMTRLNAYDKENELYKVNELYALHHPGHFSPFEKNGDGTYKYNMNYDAEGRDDKGLVRAHNATQYKFQHGSDIRKDGSYNLIAYITWTDFIANVYYMFPGEANVLEKLTSSLSPKMTPTLVITVQPHETFRRGDLPAFDLHQVHNQGYRIFYLQKDPYMRTLLARQSEEAVRQDPVNAIWFCISDLFRFYTANREHVQSDGNVMYDALRATYHQQLDQLRGEGKLRGIRGYEEEEYMQSETFDTEFLRLLPSPFAQAIYKALVPDATFQPKAPSSTSYIPSERKETVLRIEDIITPDDEFATSETSTQITESFEEVVLDFKRQIEEEGILGYHTPVEDVVLYELIPLSQVIYPHFTAKQLKARWGSGGSLETHRVGLEQQRFMFDKEGVRFVTLPHFLLHCMKLGNNDWTQRMRNVPTSLYAEYPPILGEVWDQGTSENTTSRFTPEMLAQNVTNTLWLRRNLALEASKQGYPRREFGEHNDYYNINHLGCVAGPYNYEKHVKVAIQAISRKCPSILSQMIEEQGEPTFIRIGNFISDIWRHLSNSSGNQSLADIIAGHRSMLGEGVVHGSEQVQRTLLECRQKIAELPDGIEKTAIIDQRNEIDRQLEQMDFLYEMQETPSSDGFVYLATSPILDAVKIGKWSGTMEQLQYRYRTYYGQECTVATKHISNRHYTEKALHRKFAQFNNRSTLAMNENLPKGELFDKQYLDEYQSTLNRLGEESFADIVNDFQNFIENEKGNLGYTTTQAIYYELIPLCEAVYSTLTPKQLKARWGSGGSLETHRTDLEGQGLMYDLNGVRFTTLPHFLLYCLRVGTEHTIIGRTWTSRVADLQLVVSPQQLHEEYPPLQHGFEVSTHLDTCEILTAENVAQNATNILWLKRELTFMAAKKGFPRRSFGRNDDLYNINHLACIAGPYGDVTKAKTALREKLSGRKDAPCPGLVAQQGETYVSRDIFIDEIWSGLSNSSKNQYLADAFAKADRRTGKMTRTGSTVLASVIESNQRRLLSEGTALEIEEADMQRAEVEEDFTNENLPVNDPLRGLRTNPMSETSGIVMSNAAMELELKKYEIEAQQATRRHELSLLSEERSLKIREDAITERQTITEREETQRHNEKERQETARKAHEARIVNLEARRAEADPEARKAEAHTDALRAQARIEEAKTKSAEAAASRKWQSSSLLERGPLSPLQNDMNRSLSQGTTPLKTPAKRIKRTRELLANGEEQDENNSPQSFNAVLPRTFVPPRYSDGYKRPRRGSVV